MQFSTVAPCPADDVKTTTSGTDNENHDDENQDDLPVHDHDPEQQSCSPSHMPTDETILSGSVTVMACNRTRRRFPFRTRARGSSIQKDGGGHPLLLVTGICLLLSAAVSVGLLVYSAFDPVLITKPSSDVEPEDRRFRGYILDRPTASPSSLQPLNLNMTTGPPALSNTSSNYRNFSLSGGGKAADVVDMQPTIAPTTADVNKSKSTSLATGDANATIMPSVSIPQPTIPTTQLATLEPTRQMVSDPSPSKSPEPKKSQTAQRPTNSTTPMLSIQNKTQTKPLIPSIQNETQIMPPTSSPTLMPSKHNEIPMVTSDSANLPAHAPTTTTSTGSTTGVPTVVDTSSSTLAPPSEQSLDPNTSPLPTTVPSRNSAVYTGTRPADCPDLPSIAPPLPGKKGIGMSLRPEGSEKASKNESWIENLPKLVSLNPYWNYRWGPERIDAQPDDIEFVPMAYGVNGEKSEVLMHTLSNNTKIKRILGFNEPDQENQSTVSVKTALTEWSKLEETGLPLVSPSAAKPLGTWMEKFMTKIEEECRRVDWIGVHWYGPAMFSTFTTQMRKIHAKFGGRPLLLTEFAVADHQSEERGFHRYNHSEVLEFMKEALPWLEEQDWIAGYAWFSFKQSKIKGSSSALFEDDDGQLTALGRFYASVSTENPKGDQSIDIT